MHLCLCRCVCVRMRVRACVHACVVASILIDFGINIIILGGSALGRIVRVPHCAAAAKLNRERKRVARNRQLRHALEVLTDRRQQATQMARGPCNGHATGLVAYGADRSATLQCQMQPKATVQIELSRPATAEAVTAALGAAPPRQALGY